ncbi:MAG: peroxide stress protein YaaA [Chlamydiota bacterium]|nr:peroxide stress protein YaaA [Chlamydiota bacterium]
MMIVISPAKTLDFKTPPRTEVSTLPQYLDDSAQLIKTLKTYSVGGIMDLMGVSEGIAETNVERFVQWNKKLRGAKQAILAFKGDVYTGLQAESFTESDDKFAQDHLRILSGLYGILRPLDLMLPYRLEMGTKLETQRGKNLYEFWGKTIRDSLIADIEKSNCKCLINLASNEYFKVLQPKTLKVDVVTPVFKEYKNGEYKVIALFAKKARGAMARFIIKNRITDPDGLKDFSDDGYSFNKKASTDTEYVFYRKR